MKNRPFIRLVIFAFAATACGKAPAAVDLRFLAAEDACLAQEVYNTVASDTGSFAPFALFRFRAYAALDSSLNHASAPADSARFVHRAGLHQNAAYARDRLTRIDLASEYTERLAAVAATNAVQCRRDAARKTK